MLLFVDIMLKPPNTLRRKIGYYICNFIYPPYASRTIEIVYDENDPIIGDSERTLLLIQIGLTCLISILFIFWLIMEKWYGIVSASVSYL